MSEVTVTPMLTTVELAAQLRIGREAARKIMLNTRGVVTLPPINGTGKNATRRMPLAVFEALLAQRSKPLAAKKAGR